MCGLCGIPGHLCGDPNIGRVNFPARTSIPLPGGGDTHIHPFGPRENDFTVTTRLPGGIGIHDNPLDPDNPRTNNWRYKP